MAAVLAYVAFWAVVALVALRTLSPRVLILAAVTALFLIWAVPTLLAGRFVAAYVVPPSATNKAISEMTNAGLGARSFPSTNVPSGENVT